LLQEGVWLPEEKIAACENTDLDFIQVYLSSYKNLKNIFIPYYRTG
jgi:hypothetical protein